MSSPRVRDELSVEAAQFLGGPERTEGPLKTEGTKITSAASVHITASGLQGS